jgi:hypothetical protein
MNADEHRLTEAAMNALSERINVKQQEPIKVYYDGLVVGDYFADLLVEDAIIVELKATQDSPDVCQMGNFGCCCGTRGTITSNGLKSHQEFRLLHRSQCRNW